MISYIKRKFYDYRIRHKILSKLNKHASASRDFNIDKISFSHTKDLLSPWDILIEHRANSINLAWRPDIDLCIDDAIYRSIKSRSAAYLYYAAMSGENAHHLICDISDGNHPSMADVRYSSPFANSGLLPDVYFFENSGYLKQRALYETQAVSWEERSDDIIWRGNVTGMGLRICDDNLISNGAVNQRIRMAMACKNTDIDFRFVGADDEVNVLKDMGLMGERIEAVRWLGKKFAIDIDGASNAWDNLYHRLLFGCCVLKVESQAGFKQWYYNKLKPWVHYVPIKADLSDLNEQINWVRSHPKEVEHIAAAGCELAHSMTFETETQYAVKEITRICRAKKSAS
ncbi:MAG: glycosyl transferase family 90 [Lentilitoribacter sp.]